MNNIILTGFMGCGKSSVGIRLSYQLKQIMIDTDRLIEQEAEKTIPEIFEQEGEAAFRRMETECLKRLIRDPEEKIISVGGGLPLLQENRELLRELGTVVYLEACPETIYERVQNDTARPLLQTENPEKKIRELLEEREPLYRMGADITLSVDGKEFEEILTELVQILEESGRSERRRG